MRVSENSIFFELTDAFSKDLQFRIAQFGKPDSELLANDDFCNRLAEHLENIIASAKLLRDFTSLLDDAIDSNAILWEIKNEETLKHWFLNWQDSAEKFRVYLPGCIASRRFSDSVARFLRAEEFVQDWLAKQQAYENGTPRIDVPKDLPSGGPNHSWYRESFERTF